MEPIDYLINYLLEDNKEVQLNHEAKTVDEKRNLYRSLCNVREPRSVSEEYIKIESEYLQEELSNKNVTDVNDLLTIEEKYSVNSLKNQDKLVIWQGDITKFKVGAIVNAANSKGLGCFIPLHNCIDNQIHTYAGIPLRLECDKIMKTINYNLPTGEAFITHGYNLPCDYVLHTVGPIISDKVTPEKIKELSNCYKNCLKIAMDNNIRTISFPGISTGVFRFPKDYACQIALKTVDDFLDDNRDNFDKVVFNLHSNQDVEIYERFIR